MSAVDDYFDGPAFEHIRNLLMDMVPEAGHGTSYGMAALSPRVVDTVRDGGSGTVEAVTRPPRPEIVRLYPEVGRAGSLQAAMQAAFGDAGHELTALPGAPGWRYSATMVTDGQRHVNTSLGGQERVFLMGFWERGVRMAGGNTPDLTAAAGATATWQAGSRLAALREAWPFVEYEELAEAYERGNLTQARWEMSRRSRRSRDRALIESAHAALIEAAYAQPALRVLFPFTDLLTTSAGATPRARAASAKLRTGPCRITQWGRPTASAALAPKVPYAPSGTSPGRSGPFGAAQHRDPP